MPTWLIGAAYLSVLNQWLNPWKSAESIKKLQERKLRALIDHAYRNVSYYRTLLDSAGVRPRDIRSLADLERIPPTSKADLHALPEAEKTARNIKLDRCYSFSTTVRQEFRSALISPGMMPSSKIWPGFGAISIVESAPGSKWPALSGGKRSRALSLGTNILGSGDEWKFPPGIHLKHGFGIS